jgi:hypothetical protein
VHEAQKLTRPDESKATEREQRPHGAATGMAAVALRTQQTAGNAAAQRLIQRWFGFSGWFSAATSKVVTVRGEEVEVKDATEQKEAEKLIDDMKDMYGVSVSSMSGVKAIQKDYSNAPETVRKALKTIAWKLKELRAVSRALSHYAPILGKSRKISTRAAAEQEATTVSKVDQAIDVDTASGVLDTTTLGEFFRSSKNFSMFTAGTNSEVDFPGDNDKQLEATAIHEIGHGLMEYALGDYVAGLDYWTNRNTKSGKAGAEAPITKYGAKNAAEDLCEALMFYFLEPEKLKKGRGAANGTPGNPCPKRYALVHRFVTGWRPVGDFPEVRPGPGMAYA